jgi:hypothetical protein
MLGLPIVPTSIAVIADGDDVFLSFHFSLGSFYLAKAYVEFLEGWLKEEADRTGWNAEKIEVEDASTK